MISSKRLLSILLTIVILATSVACSDPPPEEKTSSFEASIKIISDEMKVTREEALSILETLTSLGLDERIEAVYPDVDDEERTFYKVWFGLHLLSVYLDGGNVSSVYKYGEMIYPQVDEPETDNNPENNEGNNENQGENNEDKEDGQSGGKNDGSKDDEGKNEEPPELKARLISLTTPIKAGKTATIEILAEPNTEYSIIVRYSSGPSSAKGLEPKLSDELGFVSWTWRVSANVKPGEYTIEITSGDAVYKTNFTVEASADE